MNSSFNKRVLLLVGLFIFALLSIFFLVQDARRPSRVDTTIDPDTGEVLYTEPNKTPEKDNTKEGFFILGLTDLLNQGMTQIQLQKTREVITNYTFNNFGNAYSRATILPGGAEDTGTGITTKLRLGEGDRLLDFRVVYTELKFVQVYINDPTGEKPPYDSGRLEGEEQSAGPHIHDNEDLGEEDQE